MTFSTTRTVLATAAIVTVGVVTAGLALVSGAPVQVSIPGQVNATPSLAASGQVVALAWGATMDQSPATVHVAVSHDSGRTFAAPVRVSDNRSQANLAAEQPPRVTLVPRAGREPSIVVMWTSKADSGTRLIVARSEDGGRRFSRPAVLRASEAPGNRGWESVATDRQGRVLALWLDHRELAPAPGAAAHVHGAHAVAAGASDGAERALRSKLVFAPLDDPAGVREITGGVCYCCKTSLATGADGGIYAAWRHVYPGNLRDIAFAMSRDGGRTFSAPVRISEDKWQIDGCPENGPALTVDAAGRIHIVWPTLIREAGRETLALYYSTSADGRTFSARTRIPTTGAAYHPQVALTAAGELFVAWDELAAGARRVRFARGRSTARGMTFTPAPAPAVSDGGFPTIAVTANGIVAAWAARVGSATHIAVERWE
jgi:hypothetical protein